MKVIKPITITPANWYIFNQETFSEYPEYDPLISYVLGYKVVVAADKSQYQCITSNTGFAPKTNPSKWVRIGAAFAWRPFDGFISETQRTGGITSVFDATGLGLWLYSGNVVQTTNRFNFILTGLGGFDTVALLGMTCGQIKVSFYNQTGTKTYDKTLNSIDDSTIIDAWEYCFGDPTYRNDFIFDGIDGWGTTNLAQLYIEISYGDVAPDGSVVVGEIVAGLSRDIGACHADAQIQLIDYSKKEIDAYGTVSIVQRAYSLNGSFEVEVATEDRNRVQSLMTSLRATPCVYFPTSDDANQGLVIYGYVKDYNTTYETPDRAFASLEIEGMI